MAGPFTIDARDGSARAGVLRCAHGEVRTPAFVPLASNASVRGLAASEVAGLGYEMVLGNTFHLFIEPGHEHIAEMGGLHEFMGWRGPIITDSGGFQVFSMGHGSVAEEIKRRRGDPQSRVLSIEEEGVRFRAYTDGSERFMGPETSMEIQAALGSDIALAFDECTPFHVDRDYTRRSMERTHRWLDRCVTWHGEHAPRGPGAVRHRPGRGGGGPAGGVRRVRGGRGHGRDRDRRIARPGQGADARGAGLVAARPPRRAAPPPARASATSTTSCTRWARASTRSTAPRPPAWPATARRWSRSRRPLAAGPDQGRPAREPRAARGGLSRARRAATTPAATCTTWRAAAS